MKNKNKIYKNILVLKPIIPTQYMSIISMFTKIGNTIITPKITKRSRTRQRADNN